MFHVYRKTGPRKWWEPWAGCYDIDRATESATTAYGHGFGTTVVVLEMADDIPRRCRELPAGEVKLRLEPQE